MANDSQVLTLADWGKRFDPNGKVAKIVEILAQTNEILEDMLFLEGNLTTGHKTTIRTGLPEAVWRMLNRGVPKGKSTTTQVQESTGMLEVYSEVDKELVELAGDAAAFRLSEAKAFIEGINIQMARTVMYGGRETPEAFIGFAPRYNSLSAPNAENIIDAGGTGSNLTSLWLVVWGGETVHGIFPKGSKAGLQHTDKGQVTLTDENGGNFEGYRDHWQWKSGLVVRDWRYCVRICNINLSNLSAVDLVALMIEAEERIPNLNAGRAAWYCNRQLRTALRLQILNHKNVNLTQENIAGKIVASFDGMPLRRVDQILNTEGRVI